QAAAALAEGRLEAATARWKEFAWSGSVGADVAADFGVRLLEAAAERGERELYAIVRGPAEQWTERVAEAPVREGLRRRLALADPASRAAALLGVPVGLQGR